MLSITIALGSKEQELGRGSWLGAAWQGFKIMGLANFPTGSAAQPGQPGCVAVVSLSVVLSSVLGPKALEVHSAAVQGGRKGVKPKWAGQGAPSQAWGETRGINK